MERGKRSGYRQVPAHFFGRGSGLIAHCIVQPGAGVASDTGNFPDFYRDYLREHADPANRRMHFIGTSGALAALLAALVSWNPWPVPAGIVFGYACAWFGHFRYEKNRPATFRHPLYSFVGDWVMFKDILLGRLSIRR